MHKISAICVVSDARVSETGITFSVANDSDRTEEKKKSRNTKKDAENGRD